MASGPPSPGAPAATPSDAVEAAARAGEPDRHLAALLAPASVRPALLALAAFSAEVARIPALVSEPMIGAIRLQWWRDAVDAAQAGSPTGNPLADALGVAIRAHALSPAALHRVIDAREHDLTGTLHADDAAMDAYFAAVEGTVFALSHQVLAGSVLPERDAAAAGLAYGLARALCRLPALLHNGGFPISQARLVAAGIGPRHLVDTPPAPEVRAAVATAAGDVEQHGRAALSAIRGAFATLPGQHRSALLPLAMVEPYFTAQKQLGSQRLERIADVVPLVRVWRLGRARLTGRI